jgi:acyl-CoA synthetase (AMP-forming)/AMP-acid ligase II
MRLGLGDLVASQCFANPDKVAIEVLGCEKSWTYRDIWCRISALRHALRSAPSGKYGRTVAVLLPNGVDAALVFAAAQMERVIAVPVNGRLTSAEIEYIVLDADCKILLSCSHYLEKLRPVCRSNSIGFLDVSQILTPASAEPTPLGAGSKGNETSVVAYTSGTTGFPKGALYSDEYFLLNNIFRWGWEFGMTREHVVLVPGPMFHISFTGFALAALVVGAKVRIMPEFDPSIALRELNEKCSFVFLVPTMAYMIADQWKEAGCPPIEKAKFVLSAGAPLSLELISEMFEMFPNADIAEMYGWTEGTFATFEVKKSSSLVARCVGWPALGSEICLFNEAGDECEIGEVGEVGIRSLCQFKGYLGRPEDTAAAFHKGYLMSGDIGSLQPDGRLLIIDRKKDVIISGGENIYPAEIERLLLSHPDILEVAVVGIPNDRLGEVPAAVIVLREGRSQTSASIDYFCRESLASFKIPRVIAFHEHLPRNSLGKVEKYRVSHMFLSANTPEPVHEE